MIILISHMMMSLRSWVNVRRAFAHLRRPVIRIWRGRRICFWGWGICLARAVGLPLSRRTVVNAVHALTIRAERRPSQSVDGLVIVIRTAMVLSIKRSLSLLHLGAHHPIWLLITRGPGMILVLPSRLVRVFRSL